MVYNIIGKKVCTQCGAIKPLASFHRTSFNKSGRGAKCKACHSFNCHLYYLKNTQKCKDNFLSYWLKNKKKHKATVKRWHNKNRWFYSYANHRANAKKRKQEFNLTSKDVKKIFAPPKICSLTGKHLKYHTKQAGGDSPCLCRKNFAKGYSRETVRLVSRTETIKLVAQYNRDRNRRDK